MRLQLRLQFNDAIQESQYIITSSKMISQSIMVRTQKPKSSLPFFCKMEERREKDFDHDLSSQVMDTVGTTASAEGIFRIRDPSEENLMRHVIFSSSSPWKYYPFLPKIQDSPHSNITAIVKQWTIFLSDSLCGFSMNLLASKKLFSLANEMDNIFSSTSNILGTTHFKTKTRDTSGSPRNDEGLLLYGPSLHPFFLHLFIPLYLY